jgi:hypothetical protein
VDISHAPGVGVDGAFLRELIYQLGEHARRGGTAYGAAVVARRVGIEYGLAEARGIQLPRPTRAEREDAAWLAQGSGAGRASVDAGAIAPAAAPHAAADVLGVPGDISGHDRRGSR